jgi:predicted small integral membrane protein
MLAWMHWTWASAVGFGLLAALLVFLAVLDHFVPGYPRKGFLPYETTRGDRVFMSIAAFVSLVFLWLKFFPDVTAVLIFAVSGVIAVVLMKWA